MIDIFELYAPRWRNAVKAYAFDVWNGKDSEDAQETYNKKAFLFSRAYRRALENHYQNKGMRVYRGTLDGKVNEWLATQFALRDTLPVMIATRQGELMTREIERLRNDESATAQKMLNKLYDAKEGENVFKVFSFAGNYKDRAEQIGDENAYDLGTKINEGIITQFSDRYCWQTQRDKRVRDTHQQLSNLCFLFDDPPTEISKSGKSYTGNPGSNFGCRCWSDVADRKAKPNRHYVVREGKRRKNK